MKRPYFGAAAVVLLLGAIYCALAAYDLVFDEEWSRRPGAFTVSDGSFVIHESRHSHAAHVRFLRELDEFAKGPGANNQKVIEVNDFLQWKHQIKEEVRWRGLAHGYAAAGLLVVSLGLALTGLRQPRASLNREGKAERSPIPPSASPVEKPGASGIHTASPGPLKTPGRFKCKNCGEEWPENYCPECGATIDRTAQGPSPVASEPAVSQDQTVGCTAADSPRIPIIRVSKAPYLGGLICFGFGVISITVAMKSGDFDLNTMIGLLCALVGLVVSMIVLMARLWYQAWSAIQDGHARATPGQAVGYAFIPLFNVYWIFQMTWGFARDFNKFRARYCLPIAPLSEGFYLLFAINGCVNVILSRLPEVGVISSILAFVFLLAITNSLCNAIRNLGAALEGSTSEMAHRSRSWAWLTLVGTVLLCAGTFLMYDGVLYWLPKPFSGDIYAVDLKEIAIAGAVGTVGAVLCWLEQRAHKRVSDPLGSFVQKLPFLAVIGTLVVSAVVRLEVRRAHWFTHNKTVFLVDNEGERRGVGQTVRHRVIQFAPKTKKSELVVRIVKQRWVGMPAGTVVETSDGRKLPVQSDLVGLSLTLEFHNTSPVPMWLEKAPYICGKDTARLKRLSLPVTGFDSKPFPADGLRMDPGEKRVVEYEMPLMDLQKVMLAGRIYLNHGDFPWHEPLDPLPERSVLYEKQFGTNKP